MNTIKNQILSDIAIHEEDIKSGLYDTQTFGVNNMEREAVAKIFSKVKELFNEEKKEFETFKREQELADLTEEMEEEKSDTDELLDRIYGEK